MNLKQAKTKYEQKCSYCGRDIKAGWNIYVDVDSSPKRPYCKPCGENFGGKSLKVDDSETPVDLNINSKLDSIIFKIELIDKEIGDIHSGQVVISQAVHRLEDEIKNAVSSITATIISHITESSKEPVKSSKKK